VIFEKLQFVPGPLIMNMSLILNLYSCFSFFPHWPLWYYLSERWPSMQQWEQHVSCAFNDYRGSAPLAHRKVIWRLS